MPTAIDNCDTRPQAAYFDRFDICEAHAVMEWHFNIGGWLQERPSNQRRNMSTDFQLHRMRFKPRPSLEFRTLTENGKAIYRNLVNRYGFRAMHAQSVIDECRELDGGEA